MIGENKVETDKEHMNKYGTIILYLSHKKSRWIVENWNSTLTFTPFRIKEGKHNIARTRMDAWFTTEDGSIWHGVQYGSNTTAIHCKRTKERIVAACI